MIEGANYTSCDPKQNGEILLWNHISGNCRTVMFIGAKEDEVYIEKNCNITYHLFEPNSDFYLNLKKNMADAHNVKVNDFGIASTGGTKEYYTRAESFVNRFHEDPDHVFKLTTVLDYVEHEEIESVDFMKIDTEGYELEVIKGCGNFLSRIKHIQFEGGSTYIDAGYTQGDIYEILKPFGFHFYILGPNGLYFQEEPEDTNMYSNHLATRAVDEICDIVIEQQ